MLLLFLCFGLFLLAYLFSCFYYYYYYYYYHYYHFKRGSSTVFLGYEICLIWSKDVIREFKAKLVRDSGLKDYRGCGMPPKTNIGILRDWPRESRVWVGMTGLERNPIEDRASVTAARSYGPLSSSLEERGWATLKRQDPIEKHTE